jgi:haloalkane dehalogenase
VLSYLEAGPDGEARGTLLCVHGYPESGHMWATLVERAAQAGWHALAPDLPGYGDSPPDPPHTWQRMVDAVEHFHAERAGGPVALCVHDWGGLIGLRWACEHPEHVRALVISATGFFADGKWHGLARAMREDGTGEQIMENTRREAFGEMLGQASQGIGADALDEYWRAYADEERRRGQLELYRSLNFEMLGRYEGQLAGLGVPALILWGEDDPFAPLAGAERFERELPDSELVVVPGTGHFVYEEAPQETARAVTEFLGRLGRAPR